MSNYPESPLDFDADVATQLSLYALILNVQETAATARGWNEDLLSKARLTHRPMFERYVITELVMPSKSTKKIAAPVKSDRILLTPAHPSETDISRLIIRTPVIAIRSDQSIDDMPFPKTAFLEVVRGRTDRERRLLTETGLWRYGSAADLVQDATGNFRNPNQQFPEHTATLETLSRFIAEAAISTQTSFDIDA